MHDERRINVAIDTNAYSKNMKSIESFVKKEEIGQCYKVIKICLNPPTESRFKRVRDRGSRKNNYKITNHSDLSAFLSDSKKKSLKKKIDFNDYALILNNDEISFDTELKIVNAFLEPS